MPELRWSLLCHRGVVDKHTNLLSILEVLDEGTAEAPPGESPPEEVGITLNAQLVSMWARSKAQEPEHFWQAVTITSPSGETRDTGARIEGNLQSHPRTRLIIGVKAIPFGGFGTYLFNIHHASDITRVGKKVGSVRIDIKAGPAEAGGQPHAESLGE